MGTSSRIEIDAARWTDALTVGVMQGEWLYVDENIFMQDFLQIGDAIVVKVEFPFFSVKVDGGGILVFFLIQVMVGKEAGEKFHLDGASGGHETADAGSVVEAADISLKKQIISVMGI